jgi:uncharacterized protein YndB with AHSA1/START domain
VADDELLITRVFEAPLALVWRLWEDESHMRQWWGPEGFTITSFRSDFRPGGEWRSGMTSPEWGESWSSGVYRAIEKQKRIVMSFAWEEGTGDTTETTITVTFAEDAGKTVQTFHQTPFATVESRDSHEGGWNSLINKEQRYIEAMAKTGIA